MGMLDKIEAERRMCPLIFMLDTSGSMDGQSIGALNAAMEDILPEVITMNENNPDIEILIGVLSFNSDATWITGNSLVKPDEFSWKDLDACGVTALGSAFTELNKALSASSGFMQRASGSVAPVLFLLSDGDPTDDYQRALGNLRNNNWYKHAVRVAVGYGDANDAILEEFTRTSETVLHTYDTNELKKLIKFVAVTSSKVASKGGNAGDLTNETGNSDDATNLLVAELKANPPSLSDNTDEYW